MSKRYRRIVRDGAISHRGLEYRMQDELLSAYRAAGIATKRLPIDISEAVPPIGEIDPRRLFLYSPASGLFVGHADLVRDRLADYYEAQAAKGGLDGE